MILEPVGLIVMNLEFNKIAPVMVRRLDWGKKAKLSLKKESGVCDSGPGKRW